MNAQTLEPAESMINVFPGIDQNTAWYCIRTHPKHEHIAAANLRHHFEMEVFNPRVRIQRKGRAGLISVMEPLFPCYIFGLFDVRSMLEKIKFTPGVSSIVHFGTQTPSVPGEVIEDLKYNFDESCAPLRKMRLREGDAVTVREGPFQGSNGVILRAMPAAQRVHVLMDILGRSTTIDLAVTAIVPEIDSYELVYPE